MRVTQDLNSFGEIIAHAQCSVVEKKNGSHDMKQTDSTIIIQLILSDKMLFWVHKKCDVKVILHQFWVKKFSP
jgi:hypothetical protein